MTSLGVDVLQRMIARTADHGEALGRTNLVVRLWLRRMGAAIPCACEDALPESEFWTIPFFVWNHIVQSFYEQYGIDVVPGSCGDRYPYFCSFARTSFGCQLADGRRLGSMTNGQARIDPERPDEGDPLRQCVFVKEEVARGADPLWVVERAARVAVGGRFPSRCKAKGCRHREDATIYKDVYQALAIALAAGHLRKVVLDEEDPAWFSADPVRVHRSSGELRLAEGTESHSFREWCDGDFVKALEFFAGHLQT